MKRLFCLITCLYFVLVYIADNDSLLNKLAEIQQMQQMVTDTLASRQQQFEKAPRQRQRRAGHRRGHGHHL